MKVNLEAFRNSPSITVEQIKERIAELNKIKSTPLDAARKNLIEKSLFINLLLLETLEKKRIRYH